LQQQIQLLLKQQQELSQEQQRLTIQFTQQTQSPALLKLRQDVQNSEKSLLELPYNPTKEQALAARLSALTAHSNQQQTLMKEITLQDERKRTIHEKCTHARGLKTELATIVKDLPKSLLDETTLNNQEKELTQSLTNLIKEKESFIHQKGSLEAQATALKQKELELKKQTKLIKEC
ncbi:unnamed protein product, partial [marine sediment metagenome]